MVTFLFEKSFKDFIFPSSNKKLKRKEGSRYEAMSYDLFAGVNL